jgi:hypothetical protein
MFYHIPMDWTEAMECHRQPLLRIVATLYAMIGLTEGGSIERISRPLYRAVLSLLRPAESAVRRLIIFAAQGLVVKPRASRKASARPVVARRGKSKVKSSRRRYFQLIDSLLRLDAGMPRRRKPKHPLCEPRIRVLGDNPYLIPAFLRPAPPAPPPPEPRPISDGTVNAVSLCRRLEAIMDALKDLPRQAMRYARWRDKPIEQRRPPRETALRRGAPPGLREKSRHEVHEILKECDWLARTLSIADTS